MGCIVGIPVEGVCVGLAVGFAVGLSEEGVPVGSADGICVMGELLGTPGVTVGARVG